MSITPGNISYNLDVLLKKYEEQIKTVKRLMKIKNIKDNVEDIILIRYILSYGDKLEDAVNSIEKAILWRKKNVYPLLKNKKIHSGNNDLLFPDRLKPYYSFIKKTLAACEHKSTVDNQPVVIARLKLCNFTLLLDNVPENILVDYIVYSNEHEFIVCNEQTKKSNVLCRTYRFIDLKGFMLKKFDRRFLRVFANTSKLSEFLHPQLVGKTYLINAPSYIRITIETLKTFGISKRTLNKLEIPKIIAGREPADCDWFTLLVHKDDIPTYFGGNCRCENGCIPGFENDLDDPLNLNIEEIKAEIKNNFKKLKMKKNEDTQNLENSQKK
ncbi:sec14-like cytosolic factor or phosphatidylinositol/phosphatidylcholine transfer protein, putative [Plasmodium gallinaceum]|uniref:Sec14-like cytosolic factor or phosphatidylinositol/phosphatidylcholine transfer protein, putative n=1 Tax=Plasmodium gallinaceum TaxID=5849 RepID=A0A1J1GNI1_PLAGA|nr:sec14-like cytosolic factor or phosphatidylinositol/phosphatidylcholine transfer protein, putative [Plasmodium gallinaceum]CRG93876.1 sec14-like cytosolic factor or phosphatidylinositol/phosphatidylcholine transfer protein, putative [Plasmodium gallinaceum]